VLTIERAPLLFGRDPSPALVAFDLAEGGRAIRLFRRSGDKTLIETAPFSPFLLLADRDLVKDVPGLQALDPLEGPGSLRWRARFGSWGEALGARDRCRDQTGSRRTFPARRISSWATRSTSISCRPGEPRSADSCSPTSAGSPSTSR
jgi:hypothetical protein